MPEPCSTPVVTMQSPDSTSRPLVTMLMPSEVLPVIAISSGEAPPSSRPMSLAVAQRQLVAVLQRAARGRAVHQLEVEAAPDRLVNRAMRSGPAKPEFM